MQQLTVAGMPAGTQVQLFEGVIPLSVVTTDNQGRAHFATSLLSPGPHAIQAVEWKTGRKVGVVLRFATPRAPSGSFGPASDYATGKQPDAAATGDLEGKGFLDLILLNGASGSITRVPNAKGVFGTPVELAVISGPTAVSIRDFNGDGRNDLAVTTADGRVAILLNMGDGLFSAAQYFSVGSHPSSIVSADFNSDGVPDLAIANRDSNDISVLFGKGDGTFTAAVSVATGTSPRAIALADFNGDGVTDLATANFGSNNVSVLLGDGKGSFRSAGVFATGNGPSSLLSADFNGDDAPDLAVLNQIDGSAVILLNTMQENTLTSDGAASFRLGATIPGIASFASGDVNGDGYSDLLVQAGTGLSIHLGSADGTLTEAYKMGAAGPALMVMLNDFNRDGRVDAAALGLSGSLSVLSGTGTESDAAVKTLSLAPVTSNPSTTQTRRLQPYITGTSASSISLTSSPSVLRFGQLVTLSATVSPTTATGSVTFYYGTTILGTITLAGGQANLTTLLLSSGSRFFKAYYSSNTTYAPSSFLVGVSAVSSTPTPGFAPQVIYSTGGAGGIGGSPKAIALADFNGDGKSDIVTANTSGSVSVLIGNGDGTFKAATNIAVSGIPQYVATGDFNGDGKADFVVAVNSGTVNVYLGDGTGGFSAPASFSAGNQPYGIAVADFNSDGKADLAVVNIGTPHTVSVLFGNGDGTFQAAVNYGVGASASFVAAADLNNDGYPDLVTANSVDNTVSVLIANANGTFQTAVTYAVGVTPRGLAIADVSGDGNLDLVVANAGDSTLSILTGKGDGTFQSLPAIPVPTSQAPVFVSVLDLNQDGRADLIVANSNGANVSIFSGNGDGTFQSPVSFSTGPNPYGIALGDFNGDGLPDLGVVNSGSSNGTAGVSILLGSASLRFVPVTPCRVSDTRLPAGPFGGPSIARQTLRSFAIPASACNIPTTAQAYSLNVTVVPQEPLGYLTTWPAGQTQPLASTLNSYDGRTKSNAAIVPAGSSGGVSVFSSHNTDVILDINGYFVAASSVSAGLAFYPLTPCRVTDTRNPTGTFGGPYIPSQTTRSFPVASSTCGVPATAQAYSLNYTILPRLGKPFGYMTTWPTTQTKPIVSTLNAPTGVITANAALVPAGTDSGKSVSVFVTEDTDLVIDINGYFAPPTSSGLSYYSVQPCRVLDSRNPAGNPPFSGTLAVSFTGSSCAPPAASQAFVFNATIAPPAPLGYIAFWPQGQPQPVVSTLNDFDGTVVSNMAIVPAPTNPATGIINAFASDPTFLILDLLGYFAP